MRVVIYKDAIEKMVRDIQREYDKHPVIVPIRCEDPDLPISGPVSHVYNGPVFQGSVDGAQLAWNNGIVSQSQTRDIAPGFEAIAEAVSGVLKGLSDAGIGDEAAAAEEVGLELLAEVTQAEPDRSKITRALRALQGVLAPIATGLLGDVSVAAQIWAKQAIEHLNIHL